MGTKDVKSENEKERKKVQYYNTIAITMIEGQGRTKITTKQDTYLFHINYLWKEITYF